MQKTGRHREAWLYVSLCSEHFKLKWTEIREKFKSGLVRKVLRIAPNSSEDGWNISGGVGTAPQQRTSLQEDSKRTMSRWTALSHFAGTTLVNTFAWWTGNNDWVIFVKALDARVERLSKLGIAECIEERGKRRRSFISSEPRAALVAASGAARSSQLASLLLRAASGGQTGSRPSSWWPLSPWKEREEWVEQKSCVWL